MAKISDATIKIIYKHLDDVVDKLVKKLLPGVIAGPVTWLDNIVEKKGLNYLNDTFGPKIPDSLNPILDSLAKDMDAGNWQAASDAIAKGLADEIHTPLIDGTPEENAVYSYLIGTIFNLLGLKTSVEAAKAVK